MSVPYAPSRWPAASATAGFWALAAASAVFWGLRLSAPPDAIAPPAVASAPAVSVDPALVAQLLGVLPAQSNVVAAPEAASRFALLGIIADADQQGAALIVVDGKPPRPFRVGAKVVDGYVLQSVSTRSASFGARADGPSAFTLQLPTQPLAPNPPPAIPGALGPGPSLGLGPGFRPGAGPGPVMAPR